MFDLKTLRKFASKIYRDGFLHTQVRGKIAYQVRAMRKKLKLTQKQFAALIGTKQSVVSRLENTEYGKVSVQTLLDIASAANVALLVQFVSYPEFLRRAIDMSPAALAPDTIDESIKKMASAAADSTRYADRMRSAQTGGIAKFLKGTGQAANTHFGAHSVRDEIDHATSPTPWYQQMQQQQQQPAS